MNKLKSINGPVLIVLYDKYNNQYSINHVVNKTPDGDEYEYSYLNWIVTDPSIENIKFLITSYYNSECDNEILTGFKFNDLPVWLSSENQFNYKSALDISIQTDGINLPTTFKFGTDEHPMYKTFETTEDLQEFIVQMMTHISVTLTKYWNIKDNIDWSVYELTDQ